MSTPVSTMPTRDTARRGVLAHARARPPLEGADVGTATAAGLPGVVKPPQLREVGVVGSAPLGLHQEVRLGVGDLLALLQAIGHDRGVGLDPDDLGVDAADLLHGPLRARAIQEWPALGRRDAGPVLDDHRVVVVAGARSSGRCACRRGGDGTQQDQGCDEGCCEACHWARKGYGCEPPAARHPSTKGTRPRG